MFSIIFSFFFSLLLLTPAFPFSTFTAVTYFLSLSLLFLFLLLFTPTFPLPTHLTIAILLLLLPPHVFYCFFFFSSSYPSLTPSPPLHSIFYCYCCFIFSSFLLPYPFILFLFFLLFNFCLIPMIL